MGGVVDTGEQLMASVNPSLTITSKDLSQISQA